MSNYTQQVYGDISKQWYTPSYGMYFFQSSAAGVNSISNSTAGGYWQLDIMTTTPAIYSYLQNYQESWYSTYDDSRTYASIAANLPLSKFKGDWLDAELSAWPAAQFSSTKLTPLSGADTGFPYIAANGTRNWTAYPAPHLENEIEPKRDPAEVAAYCWDPDCQNPQAFDTQVPQMYAYNWGNRIYCVNELSKLGFSASDLKP
jgi:hypothetical protein